jgi:hypothetical protein
MAMALRNVQPVTCERNKLMQSVLGSYKTVAAAAAADDDDECCPELNSLNPFKERHTLSRPCLSPPPHARTHTL